MTTRKSLKTQKSRRTNAEMKVAVEREQRPNLFGLCRTGATSLRSNNERTEVRDRVSSDVQSCDLVRAEQVNLLCRTGATSLRSNNLRRDLRNLEVSYRGYEASFEKKDRIKTVLIPWFTDFLSPLVPAVAELAGYHFVNCPPTSKVSAEIGLKYGHNEVCYPATLILGDLIAEIQTGKYPLDNIAVAITQTGGQCRATNYISLIKNGLKNAGFGHIPVIAVSFGGVHNNKQDGFKLPIFKILYIALYAFLFADSLNQIFASTVARESAENKGEAKRLFDLYMKEAEAIVRKRKYKKFLPLLERAVEDFNKVPVNEISPVKIGLVGEIFVKYNNFAQWYITDWLRDKGCEVVVPSMLDFFMQSFVNSKINRENGLSKPSLITRALTPLLLKFLQKHIGKFDAISRKSRFYHPHNSIFETAKSAEQILSLSNQFGEGWLIAGEVANFAKRGINKIVCIQPFGCIANHVVAKGIEKRLKKFYPEINLLFLDIDSGISEVNLQNRLHFLLQ